MDKVIIIEDGQEVLIMDQDERLDALVEAAMIEAEDFFMAHRNDGLWLRFEAHTRRERGVQCIPGDPWGALFELTFSNRLEHLMFHFDNQADGWA